MAVKLTFGTDTGPTALLIGLSDADLELLRKRGQLMITREETKLPIEILIKSGTTDEALLEETVEWAKRRGVELPPIDRYPKEPK